jgi:hypothetical protein
MCLNSNVRLYEFLNFKITMHFCTVTGMNKLSDVLKLLNHYFLPLSRIPDTYIDCARQLDRWTIVE